MSTDELDIHAYVDGELDDTQQAEFLEAMRNDPELSRRVCELGQLKAQLRLAYADPPAPRARIVRGGHKPQMAVAAGVALLAVGVAGGWLLHSGVAQSAADANRFAVLDPQGRGQAPAVAENEETRIVFHLTNADQAVAGELLDEIERMLVAYRSDHRPLRVEVVSHSEGLGLLRERLSQHKGRIHELAQRFDNLTFVACRNTIERLRVEKGIEVKLIPDAEVIESGVTHVVKRQKQGWSYIRV